MLVYVIPLLYLTGITSQGLEDKIILLDAIFYLSVLHVQLISSRDRI